MFKFRFKPWWLVLAILSVLTALGLHLAKAITAFAPANQPVGYVAQDEMTNYNLTSGHEVLYRGQYEREYWGGNLIAYGMNSAGDISIATQPWNGGAAYQIELQGTDRRIVTLKSDGSKIPFAWSSLSATQQSDLVNSATVDYLRGVRTGEVQLGGTFRQRASAMGDVIHSRPLYVSDSTSAAPMPTVFVGANDGMLHAINALSGAERWAYVPSMLIAKMKNLSVNPPAGSSFVHDYYVDGSTMVATILSGSKRVLVGALGAGGKGLYALDITASSRLAPATEAAAANNILWEITPSTINNVANAAYANLGYTLANPSLVKVGSTDAVMVGNGYNNGGDYQAYLYLINADTGALIAAIKAGTSGTSGSPNGLSTPVAVDSDGNGSDDIAYAGDLNGTMWKFDLNARTASTLLTTSPAQPITMTPGVTRHPSGGFMVNFATGAALRAADMTDTATYSAYGIWDGAPAANAVLLTQTLSERCYTVGTSATPTPCASRVRTVTANQPDWSAGATHHKGWKVDLPAGEKVVGDGSYTEMGRFYFNAFNPNVTTAVEASTVYGENWLMELDAFTGGAQTTPLLDLNGDHVISDDDRVKDSASPRAPVMTSDGVPIGKFISNGVGSQPILVQLSTLNNTLFNQNPDVTIVPVELGTGAGVTGGHFDEDIYYGTLSGGARASATLTISSTGQTSGWPATLGDVTVDGRVLVPAMTVLELTNGVSTSTNATAIKDKINGAGSGFSASVSGSVVTVTGPLGTQFNGQAITVGAGSSAHTSVEPTPGTLVMTAVRQNKSISIRCGGVYVGSSSSFTSSSSSTASTRLNSLYSSINGRSDHGYTLSCSKSGSPTSSLTCSISAPASGSACTAGFTVDSDITVSTNTGPQGGDSGWTDFAPAVSASAFNSSGVDPVSSGDTCTSGCQSKKHFHQYDDNFDVTGVNYLNPSSTTLDISNGIGSLTQNFKVIVSNQYLSPAVKLHIGDPSYLYNVDFGYINLRTYQTSASLDLATVQTYRRDPAAVWPGAAVTVAEKLAQAKPIGSLAINMPLDALTAKDWLGNGDIRVGLHPTKTDCVKKAAGATDGNMYQPVIPPADHSINNGRGTNGYSGSTTPASATGVRHNGALVVQLIRDTTPNSALELSVSGHPEYGWRVKSASYSTYVLTEYTTFWHHPNGFCYGDAGWTKTPGTDAGTSSLQAKAAGSTDPKLGDLSLSSGGSGGTITSVTTTVVGNVTTTLITYTDGSTASIVRTVNSDGTVTIVTTDALGAVTSQTIANQDGSLRTGGDERAANAARTGRISWRELLSP